MPTVVTNEDHPMENAPEAEANVGTNVEEDFIDLNDQRIRVASQLISRPDIDC
jgi:hypothetical protein